MLAPLGMFACTQCRCVDAQRSRDWSKKIYLHVKQQLVDLCCYLNTCYKLSCSCYITFPVNNHNVIANSFNCQCLQGFAFLSNHNFFTILIYTSNQFLCTNKATITHLLQINITDKHLDLHGLYTVKYERER